MQAVKRGDPPTERQAEILRFMIKFRQLHHHPPTLREIGEGCRIESTNAVTCHLKALEKRGLVVHRAKRSRGWHPSIPESGEVISTRTIVDRLLLNATANNEKADYLRALRDVIHYDDQHEVYR